MKNKSRKDEGVQRKSGARLVRSSTEETDLDHEDWSVPIVQSELEKRVRERTMELAEANAALRASEARFRTTFDHAGIGMTIVDITGTVVAGNPAFSRFIGYSQEELVGMNVQEYAYGPDLAHGNELLHEMIEGKRDSYQVEKRYVRKDGKVVWGRLTASIAHAERVGEAPFIIGMIEDITDRVEAEQRERELEAHKLEFYRRTILAATDGKLVITGRDEIEKLAGDHTVAEWQVRDLDDVTSVRLESAELARSEGVGEEDIKRLTTCVGEAVSNALKHADGGIASFHRMQDSVVVRIEDTGSGIGAMSIPDVALVRGYSTTGTLGMGYKIMIASADRVYLATGPEGTTVACVVAVS